MLAQIVLLIEMFGAETKHLVTITRHVTVY